RLNLPPTRCSLCSNPRRHGGRRADLGEDGAQPAAEERCLVLEDHAGCGEALPEGVAARDVQSHLRFHLPLLEAFRVGFLASGVISSSTNHFVIHMQLLGSGFGMKEHSTSLLNLELYSSTMEGETSSPNCKTLMFV
uniref:Uncharacterized protein n=1 Tax=Triticum urartu TaxID=4572 RepID=A0A8R7K2A6_TRIUA